MKRYEQRDAAGRVIDRLWRPEQGYGNRPAGHGFLYGPADDEFGRLNVGESVKFSGQTRLYRVA